MSLEEIQSYPRIQKIIRTGSREICNPPPIDTDEDWLVLIAPEDKDHFNNFFALGNLGAFDANQGPGGWEIGGSHVDGLENEFTSLKKGEMNIIMTTDPLFFKYFEAATSVAKKLNLLDKKDRIMLFEAVMKGQKYEEPVQVIAHQIQPFPFAAIAAGGNVHLPVGVYELGNEDMNPGYRYYINLEEPF